MQNVHIHRVAGALWKNMTALNDKAGIQKHRLVHLTDNWADSPYNHLEGMRVSGDLWGLFHHVTCRQQPPKAAETPDNISVPASDSDLRMQAHYGDTEWSCCLAMRGLKFSGDGIAVCQDRGGSKHLCAQGSGLAWIEMRLGLISREAKSVCSQTQTAPQREVTGPPQLTRICSAAFWPLFLQRRCSPSLNANK